MNNSEPLGGATVRSPWPVHVIGDAIRSRPGSTSFWSRDVLAFTTSIRARDRHGVGHRPGPRAENALLQAGGADLPDYLEFPALRGFTEA